jgi:hypothetical protein
MKIVFLSFKIAFTVSGSISHSDNTRGWEIDQLEDLGVDGRLILKCIFKKWDGCVDWIDLVQDIDSWRAVVNAAGNIRVPQTAGNFLSNCGPVGFSRRSLLRGVGFNLTFDMS